MRQQSVAVTRTTEDRKWLIFEEDVGLNLHAICLDALESYSTFNIILKKCIYMED